MTAVVQKQHARVVKAGNVEVGRLDVENLTVERTGTPTNIPGNLYGDTNFYIQQSRQYFPDKKFHTYIYIPLCHLLYLIIFLGSFLTLLNFIYAFVMVPVNAAFMVMFIQHLYVVHTTMRYVLRQPGFPNHFLSLNNHHLLISLEQYRARYASFDKAEIGLIQKSAGKVKLQVFRKRAIGTMKNTVVVAVFGFMGSLFHIFFCLAVGIYRVIEPFGGEDN